MVDRCFAILAEVPMDRFGEENIDKFISKNKMTEQEINLFMSFIQLEKARRNL